MAKSYISVKYLKFICFAQKQKTMGLEGFSFFFKANFNVTYREYFLFTLYALQQIKAISYGKMSINKIIAVFGKIFNIDLKDSHHAFHRMKTRAKSRTAFLDELKKTLEEYMDR